MSARILIADDHEVIRKALRAALEDHPGWQVCAEAHDGKEAVDKAAELTPDLVIVDLSMPELNGLEAATQIHEMTPATPVLLFTVYRFPALEAEAAKHGVKRVIDKGGPVNQLLGAVAEALGEQKNGNGQPKSAAR